MIEYNEPGRSTRGTLSGSNLHGSGLETSSGSSHTDEMEDADFDEVDHLVSNTGQHRAMSQLLPHRHFAKTLLTKYFDAIYPLWPFL